MMTEEEKNELLFNRQFIITSSELNGFNEWNTTNIGNLFVYSHPNLEVAISSIYGKSVVLIGFIFDSKNPTFGNQQIVDILVENETFEAVLENSAKYAGRFLIIYCDDRNFKLFHDAAGQREVFYLKKGSLWLASQPSLLSEYVELQKCVEGAEFYNSEKFQLRKERILDTTQYFGVKHLSVNHYLDLHRGESTRYYPGKKVTKLPLEEAVKLSSKYIKGFLEAASYRYKLMIAVTGGWDSRMMLAASMHIPDSHHYFIFKHKHLKDTDQDIKTPKKLLEILGVDYYVIEYDAELEDDVKALMTKNVELSNPVLYPAFYNEFFKKYKDRLNVTCVSEAARNYFHYQANQNNVSGAILARLNKFEEFDFVKDQYQKWIDNNAVSFKNNGYNILDMFYWEEKMGNWFANGRSAMGSAIEDFSPFNCRELMTIFLSVDEKYRDRYNPVLHRKIIEKLSIDVLAVPVNGSLKYILIKWLVIFRIYPIYKKIQLLLKAN
ncbi:hypothetical protein [Reichenbachiella sp. MALMAid0571]|uniref:hypothetical protein n=1 Tax=Reichenbachiella sp. MALMAid0571 TaxID=3143939 RepID=UPI0032DF0F9C